MNIFTNEILQLSAVADLVIEVGNDVYLCYLNAALRSGNTPLVQQNIWRICKMRAETTTENSVSVTRTYKEYPNGDMNFAFSPNDYLTYTYSFAR